MYFFWNGIIGWYKIVKKLFKMFDSNYYKVVFLSDMIFKGILMEVRMKFFYFFLECGWLEFWKLCYLIGFGSGWNFF